eukprot:Sspe_Gene.7142::Locus_2414_Transcript_2_2_Confidence_0.800_Length_2649::g.7142::m.7142/K03514/PAPD5_7, TRF4; non-canonical poly(A) RNA polymerase PAPD5/7
MLNWTAEAETAPKPTKKPWRKARSNASERSTGSSEGRSKHSMASNVSKGGEMPKYDGLVYSPWYHNGEVRTKLCLRDELFVFADFMSLDPEEVMQRETIIQAIRGISSSLWSGAKVDTYGSYAHGISCPTSALDIVVEHCGDTSGAPEAFRIIGEIKLSELQAEIGGFIQLHTPTGITVNITFHSGESGLRESVPVVTNWKQQFPGAFPVVVALRHVLLQACPDCLDVCQGGLSTYAILCMVIVACRRVRDASDPAEVMMTFLQYFGYDFDYKTQSASTHAPEALSKVHADEQISVLDPLDATRNITSGCTHLRQIRAHLQLCLIALRRWETESETRDRTPLSMIVSHQPLWVRSKGKRKVGSSSADHSPKDSPKARRAKEVQSSPRSSSPHSSKDGASSQAGGSSSEMVPVLYMPFLGANGELSKYMPVAVLPQTTDNRSELRTQSSHSVMSRGSTRAESLHSAMSGSESYASAQSAPVPGTTSEPIAYTVVVEFRYGRVDEFGSPKALPVGAHAMVETSRGQDVGIVLASHHGPPPRHRGNKGHQSIREATEAEIALWRRNAVDEASALSYMREQVAKQEIPITVHGAEYQFDRRKLTFHYSSEISRPPFQFLLHDGYRRFRCRIWLNNCQPKGSEPGEPIDLIHFKNAERVQQQQLLELQKAQQQATQARLFGSIWGTGFGEEEAKEVSRQPKKEPSSFFNANAIFGSLTPVAEDKMYDPNAILEALSTGTDKERDSARPDTSSKYFDANAILQALKSPTVVDEKEDGFAEDMPPLDDDDEKEQNL